MKIPKGIYSSRYRAVSNALRVSADDLIRSDYPDSTVQCRAQYPSKTVNYNNCIAIYRRQKGWSFQRLAEVIGVTTRERARQICSSPSPLKKHIEALARYENVSYVDFISKYSSYQEESA